MSPKVTVKFEGVEEKVWQVADTIEEFLPGLKTWVVCADKIKAGSDSLVRPAARSMKQSLN